MLIEIRKQLHYLHGFCKRINCCGCHVSLLILFVKGLCNSIYSGMAGIQIQTARYEAVPSFHHQHNIVQ